MAPDPRHVAPRPPMFSCGPLSMCLPCVVRAARIASGVQRSAGLENLSLQPRGRVRCLERDRQAVRPWFVTLRCSSTAIAARAPKWSDPARTVFAAQDLVLDVQLGGSGRGDGELDFELLDPLAQAPTLGSLLGEGTPQCLDLMVSRLRAVNAAGPFLEDSRSAVHRRAADARFSVEVRLD